MRGARSLPTDPHPRVWRHSARNSRVGAARAHIFDDVTQSACVAPSAGTSDSSKER
jgi:hypothetical protein